jgi:lipoate-protein ligase A
MNCFLDVSEFRSEMMNFFLKNFPDNFPYSLTREDINQAQSLADSKYKTWEWNWAYGPEYTFKNRFELNKTGHSCNLFIKDGIIRESIIEGSDQMKRASNKLIGSRHMVNDLSDVFRNENIFLTEQDIYNFF